MNLPILILFTFILNILFSMTSSIVSTNKEIEDESYKYQATLKWLSLCMEVFGTLMSVIYLQSLIHGPLLYVVVLLLVYAYILLSDLLPRKFANAHLDKFEKTFMSIAKGIQSLFTPFTFFLRFEVEKEQEDYSEEDIYEVINGGGVEPSQKEFIENLFEFDDTPVEEICTHRSEVVCLYLNDDKETWKKTILENRHTLYPVCDEDNDDVVGILDTRDYFRLDSIEQDNVINKAMDQPFFISQNMKADVLLKEMKIKKVYFAVLLDEYGGMTGIVTLHDIIETLLGEIQEDDDIDEPDPIQQIDSDQFRIYGQADIEDVEKALGISLEDEDCDTFGGYILNHYGQIPDEGSHFKVSLDLMDVYVKEVKNHRIGQTIVQIKRKEEGNQHESTEKRNRD
ncbi:MULTISPECIES: transporter associated domain-containing protein [Holdemanella]|uniref:HlyC/CorC family transporter n=1 Tax=Holdemanella biformis TaxID=1735 RepID=A0A412J9Z2_9FIRM|nr:hemolysin family protein [Holdemanella biformis]MBV4130441.1 hemolysin family protein [Holdemanella biformis]MBV4150187.1 hemolysin family protein [Holdemanella biformis]RGS49181.1 HlyC/CorC family transporter [Holdemanella biformis]